MGRWFGGHDRKIDRERGDLIRRRVGKKRRHMAVFAHAQENDVQRRQVFWIPRRYRADFFRGRLGGWLGLVLSADAMDFFRRKPQGAQQEFVRERKVAVRILRRNTPFVRPKKMDVV